MYSYSVQFLTTIKAKGYEMLVAITTTHERCVEREIYLSAL